MALLPWASPFPPCLPQVYSTNELCQSGWENNFCSGYSWLAEQVDLTGSRGGVVFLGANFGWLIFPPIGLQITSKGQHFKILLSAGAVLFSGPWSVGLFHLSLGSYQTSLYSVLLESWFGPQIQIELIPVLRSDLS